MKLFCIWSHFWNDLENESFFEGKIQLVWVKFSEDLLLFWHKGCHEVGPLSSLEYVLGHLELHVKRYFVKELCEGPLAFLNLPVQSYLHNFLQHFRSWWGLVFCPYGKQLSNRTEKTIPERPGLLFLPFHYVKSRHL